MHRRTTSHVVGRSERLPPGSRLVVDIAGRSVGIFNFDGELYAIRNVCPHHGARLCEGRLAGTMVTNEPGEYRFGLENRVLRSPWHGFEFDIATGEALAVARPRMRVRVYPVRVEDGDIVVEM